MTDAIKNPPDGMPRITAGVYYEDSAANRILLARYCNPFGISSCSLVVVLKNHDRVLLENNDEPNLVEHRHDLKPWLGKTLRIGFSGGQMRMDYLKTLPGR